MVKLCIISDSLKDMIRLPLPKIKLIKNVILLSLLQFVAAVLNFLRVLVVECLLEAVHLLLQCLEIEVAAHSQVLLQLGLVV